MRPLAIAAFDVLFAFGVEVAFSAASRTSLRVWAFVFRVVKSVAVFTLLKRDEALHFQVVSWDRHIEHHNPS